MNERVRLTRKTFGRILRGNFIILEVKRKSGINMIYSWPESGQTWAHSINCQTKPDYILKEENNEIGPKWCWPAGISLQKIIHGTREILEFSLAQIPPSLTSDWLTH